MELKTASMMFGRFNPPTAAHLHVFKKCTQIGDPWVFMSHTHDNTKNPLTFDEKIKICKKSIPNVNFGSRDVKNIIEACKYLNQLKYKNLVYVAGSDRSDEFENLLKRYNGTEYNFENINVVCAGKRSGTTKIENTSGSLLRKYVIDNDQKSFEKYFINPELSNETFSLLRKRLRS